MIRLFILTVGIAFAGVAQAYQCIDIFQKSTQAPADKFDQNIFTVLAELKETSLNSQKISGILDSYGASDSAIFLARVLSHPFKGRTIHKSPLYFEGSSTEFMDLFISQYKRFSGEEQATFLRYYLESPEGLEAFYSFQFKKADIEYFFEQLEPGALSATTVQNLVVAGNLAVFTQVSYELIESRIVEADRANFPFVLRMMENQPASIQRLFIDSYNHLRLDIWPQADLEKLLRTVSESALRIGLKEYDIDQARSFILVLSAYSRRNSLFKMTPEILDEAFKKLKELSKTVDAQHMRDFATAFIEVMYREQNADIFYKVFKKENSVNEIFDLLTLSNSPKFTPEVLQEYLKLRTTIVPPPEPTWWQKLTHSAPMIRRPINHEEALKRLSESL